MSTLAQARRATRSPWVWNPVIVALAAVPFHGCLADPTETEVAGAGLSASASIQLEASEETQEASGVSVWEIQVTHDAQGRPGGVFLGLDAKGEIVETIMHRLVDEKAGILEVTRNGQLATAQDTAELLRLGAMLERDVDPQRIERGSFGDDCSSERWNVGAAAAALVAAYVSFLACTTGLGCVAAVAAYASATAWVISARQALDRCLAQPEQPPQN